MTSIYKAKVNTWKMAQEKETTNKKERFTEAEKEEDLLMELEDLTEESDIDEGDE